MSYIHLIIEKRSQIKVLRKEGYSIRRIAALVGVHYSTICRELNRITGEYVDTVANQDAINKVSNKYGPSKLTVSIAAYVESRLHQTWSLEQLIGAELIGKLSIKAIYNWLHKKLLKVDMTVLQRKGKRPGTQEKQSCFTTFVERKTRFYIAIPMKDRTK